VDRGPLEIAKKIWPCGHHYVVARRTGARKKRWRWVRTLSCRSQLAYSETLQIAMPGVGSARMDKSLKLAGDAKTLQIFVFGIRYAKKDVRTSGKALAINWPIWERVIRVFLASGALERKTQLSEAFLADYGMA